MKQTPSHDQFNPDVLALMPPGAARVVEVGCSSGALAREYRKLNPGGEYIGIELEPEYAAVAAAACTRVISVGVEHLDDPQFDGLFPSDCWIFGDVLEHLFDPWALLRRIRAAPGSGGCLIACVPNAQHWSMQARLNSGRLQYEDTGLMDRTHIRWFTRKTLVELFGSSGFRIVEGRGRIFDEPQRERGLRGVRALAEAIGVDAEEAVADATPLQWVVRAVPA